jgi:hypothetical protein
MEEKNQIPITILLVSEAISYVVKKDEDIHSPELKIKQGKKVLSLYFETPTTYRLIIYNINKVGDKKLLNKWKDLGWEMKNKPNHKIRFMNLFEKYYEL